jgi:hypothetical protein
MAMTSKEFGEQINMLINKGLAANLSVTTIEAALTQAGTLLTGLTTAPTHDRTIEDPGPGLNPSQP